MRYFIYGLLLCCGTIQSLAQTNQSENQDTFFVTPELLIGKTMEANTGFPKTKLQKALFVNFGTYSSKKNQRYSMALGYPRTGFSIGTTDFGNTKKIGYAYTLMSFVEFDLFQKKSSRWSLYVGMGAAYIDTKFDVDSNPFNLAVTTDVNWAFRSFLYYKVFNQKLTNWRMGIGYAHFSNGHTRLPNQGLNSFLVSLSSTISTKSSIRSSVKDAKNDKKTKTVENYFQIRTGIGQNVLSRIFNDKKEVYSIAISTGKVVNKTFKYGVGAYYRFYEHYYDHIKDDGQLINEQVPEYRENPYKYATNFGVFGTAELLMGHVGIEFNLGINLYKPFYKIDWQLSQGYFYQGQYARLGELDSYFKIKRTISSRLGMKYYLINTNASPKHNWFLSAHINANLGQADFSELSLGYVYRFNFKENKKAGI